MLNLNKKLFPFDKNLLILAVIIFVFQLAFPQYTHAATFSDDEIRIQMSDLNMKNVDGLMLFDPNDSDPDELAPAPAIADQASIAKPNIKQLIKKKIKILPLKFDPQEVHDFVISQAKAAGLDPREVDRIVRCESQWNPGAVNARNRNGSYDLGLWQINSIHNSSISDADKLDYKKATQWAISKRLDDGNWSAWYCARRLGIS